MKWPVSTELAQGQDKKKNKQLMESTNRIIHFEERTKTNISILLDCALCIMLHYECLSSASAMPAGIETQ